MSQTCVICFEGYDLRERKPKFLSCHHTFCKLCLQGLEANGAITCPNCRVVTKVANKDAVAKLQSNYYILEFLMDKDDEERSSSAASSNPPTPAAVDLSWCPQCRSSESPECRFKGHVAVDLSKDEDLKASTAELQQYFSTCKFKWQSALTQRERAAESIDSVHTALNILSQKAQALQRDNQNKISHLRYLLNGVEKASNTTRNRQKYLNGIVMKDLLLKNSSRAEKSDVEYRNASVLVKSVEAIGDSSATVLVKNSKGSAISTPLFQDAKLGFTSAKTDGPEQDSHLLTTLSFLCLAAGPSGDELLKHLKLWTPPAPSGSAPFKPFKPQEGKQNPHKPAGDNQDFVMIDKPNAKPFKPQHNPGKPQHQQHGGATGRPHHQHPGANPSTAPPHVHKNKQPKQQEGDTQGGAKPKQHQHPRPNKKSGTNPGAVGNNPMFQSNSKETASNLGDILKQAAIEAAIGGLQNLAVSLNEEKMNISTQKKNKK